MKENVRNISVLIPSPEKSQIPSLGYSSVKEVLTQAFPDININPVYLDSTSALKESDILIANFYSTLGFIDLLRIFNEEGLSADRGNKRFTTIIGGTGSLNPLPIKEAVDYIVLDEKNLVSLISSLSQKQPHPWEQPNPIWSKTDYITSIMPTLSCIYNCVFCQLKKQNGSRFQFSNLDKINEIISREKPNRILLHSASILQYPYLNDLLRILEESKAKIYLGSMNLIDVNEQVAVNLLKLDPRHSIAAEKDSDVQLFFGLETGSGKVLKEMKKPLTPQAVIQKVQILRNTGFKHLGFYLIVGYPGAHENEFEDTAEMLNKIANIMEPDGKISVKCTPFLPHLATEVSLEPAKRWLECVRELNLIKAATNKEVEFDISDSFYYLTSIVFIRGGKDHFRLLQRIASQKQLDIENDEAMEVLLKYLNLPDLNSHLTGKPPLDLSKSPKSFIRTEDL